MIAWILYVLLVAALLGLAALAFEASALLRRKGTRWLWGLSIAASLALPFAISSITVQLPNLTRAAPQQSGGGVPLRQMTESALSPAQWVAAASPDALILSPPVSVLLTWLWAASSALMLLGLLASGLRLRRLRRGWRTERVAGQPVLVSEEIGPAVVGLLDPVIVVPRWLLDSPLPEQELVIAHEQSHLEANDAPLLLAALCLVVCMPWNLPLWWQLRRLRRAVEVDCDARVLRRGHDIGRYGEILVAVGERHSRQIAVVAAMTESKSFLEQRIRTMLRKKAKFAGASALALLLVGLMLAAGAAEVTPPNGDRPAHREIAVDAKILQGYVGKYKFGSKVLDVTLAGAQLSAQMSGQPSFPLFAESSTKFFYKVVDAQITFAPDAKGVAQSLVLHQNGSDLSMPRIDAGTADKLSSQAAERFAKQTANPASEAALRHLMESIAAGHLDYSLLNSDMAAAFRKQEAVVQQLQSLGPVKSIRFTGVGKDGNDFYSVLQENGATHWHIGLDEKGIIADIGVLPGA